MAVTHTSTTTANVIVPDYHSASTFSFNDTSLTNYNPLVIPASSSAITVIGIANMPILTMNTVSRITAINIYMRTAADGSNADTWTLRFLPVWHDKEVPQFPADEFKYTFYNSETDGTKTISRTHPANTNTIDTAIHFTTTGETVRILGGGSVVTVATPGKFAFTAQFLIIDIVADTNDEITISDFNIWGSRESV